MEKVALSAGAVKSADIIVAEMVARLLPVYLGGAFVDVCQTAEGEVNRTLCSFEVFFVCFFNRQSLHKGGRSVFKWMSAISQT